MCEEQREPVELSFAVEIIALEEAVSPQFASSAVSCGKELCPQS